MKFLMLICADPANRPADEPEFTIEEWLADVDSRKVHLDGDRLRPASDARTVRHRDGQAIVSEGPFAETHEAIGGYDVLECASLDEAVEIASRHPVAHFGAIEVRPIWPDLGAEG